jgi:hypothetical protein
LSLSSLFPILAFSFFLHSLLSFYSTGSLLSVSNSRFSFFFTSPFRFAFGVSLLCFQFPFLFLPSFPSFISLSWVSLICFQFPFLFILHFPPFVLLFESLFFVSNSFFPFFLHFLLSFDFLRPLFSISNSPFLFLPSVPPFVFTF